MLVLQNHVVPLTWIPGMMMYACCGKRGRAYADLHQLKLVAEVNPADFQTVVRKALGARLLRHATSRHHGTNPEFSAKQRLTTGQAWFFAAVLTLCVAGVIYLPLTTVWTIASAAVALFFLSVVALRLFCALPKVRARENPLPRALRSGFIRE